MRSATTKQPSGFEFRLVKSTDPASLQNLNDIVLPATVGWWPLAPGWFVLLGLLLVALAWIAYKAMQRWKNNRYRRAALHQLQLLALSIQSGQNRDAGLRQIPILLKRTALSAYPRELVASLSGKEWYRFLNSTVQTPGFTSTVTDVLKRISYGGGELSAIEPAAASAVLDASKYWLQHHQTPSVQIPPLPSGNT